MAEYVEVENGSATPAPNFGRPSATPKPSDLLDIDAAIWSASGAMAPANEHQLAIGGLPLSEDRLSLREAANRRSEVELP